MNRLRSRGATIEHALQLLPNLRPEDRRELLSSTGGEETGATLARSIGMSDLAGAVLDHEDDVVMIYGVGRLAEGMGAPWMVASTKIEQHAREVARRTHFYVDALNRAYPLLHNRADLRNRLHLRWLAWAGFRFGKVVLAKDGSPFIEFYRDA